MTSEEIRKNIIDHIKSHSNDIYNDFTSLPVCSKICTTDNVYTKFVIDGRRFWAQTYFRNEPVTEDEACYEDKFIIHRLEDENDLFRNLEGIEIIFPKSKKK